MSKQLIYLQETKLNFYSKPISFILSEQEFFVLTDVNTIIFKTNNTDKSTLSISKYVSLEKKEMCIILERLSKSEFLLITNKLKVFRFEIDFQTQTFTNIIIVGFQYGKNLKKGNINVVHKTEGHVFVQISNLIFDFVVKENQFKIFKIVNDQIIDLKFEEEFLFILTTNSLTKFVFKTSSVIHIPRQIYKHDVQDISQIEIFDEQVYLLDNNSQITIFNQQKKIISNIFTIKKSSGAKILVSKMIKTDDNNLLVYNDIFLFLFSEQRDSILNIFKISEYDFLINNNRAFSLNRKTENIFKTINIKSIKYNQLNKHDLFYKQTPEAQLSLLLAYLSKQYFKRMEMNNHLELLKDLLAPLYLRKAVLSNPKMKDYIIKFFTIVKDFATLRLMTSIDKFIVDKPQVDFLTNDDFNLEDQKYHTCPTAANSICSFSVLEDKLINKPKVMNYDHFNFTDREKRIIANNLKKKKPFFGNNYENYEIRFLRAQNRIVRLNSGRSMFLKIVSKTGFDFKEKLWFCFFVFDKFKMHRSFLILMKFVQEFDIRVSRSRINKSLNQDFNPRAVNF